MMSAPWACVFPGQGSQQVGMLASLAAELPDILPTFQAASDVLGYDLWQLVQQGPQDDLNLTEFAQPALLTASVALWRAWCRQSSARPAFMAGHSLGEWSALVAAGVVAFEDAVKLVQLRGRFMQAAVPVGVGGMAVILDLADTAIQAACAEAAHLGEVAAVNFNAPGQVVIAGEMAALDSAMAACKAAGAKRAMKLPVSAPFHTRLMQPAAENLRTFIEDVTFNAPNIPVIHNVHAAPEANPQAIKALMVQQIYSPVLWVDTVKRLVSHGVQLSLEVGSGKVLSGLNKRIASDLQLLSTTDAAAWAAAVAYFSGETHHV